MHPQSNRLLSRFCLGMYAASVFAFAATGCQKPGGDKKAGEQAAEGEEKSAGPCDDYAKKLCKEAGETSQTCGAIKTATGLMPAKACTVGLSDIQYSVGKLAESRKKCTELVDKLCKDIGSGTETCKMVKEQTKQFPPERCEMMMKQYPQVLASLKRREQMNKPLSSEMMSKVAASDAPAFGPSNAKVTIVEFSDFECPFCSRAAKVVTQIRKKYGDKVRFVFRQFPLPMHPNAQKAAEAALAAHAQGKFWEFHDHLFENQKKLDLGSLEGYAKKAGLNVTKFKTALTKNTFKAAVDKDKTLGTEISVQGTPTMFINGKRVANPTQFPVVSQMIEEALKGGAKPGGGAKG